MIPKFVDVTAAGDCSPQAIVPATFKRIVLAAKTDLERQMDKCFDLAEDARELADTGWDLAANALNDAATEYRILLEAWGEADRLHDWIDRLPQPGDVPPRQQEDR